MTVEITIPNRKSTMRTHISIAFDFYHVPILFLLYSAYSIFMRWLVITRNMMLSATRLGR